MVLVTRRVKVCLIPCYEGIQRSTANRPKGELEILRRIWNLTKITWSSIEDGDDLAQNPSMSDLAVSNLKVWARIFKSTSNRPFTRLLGETLDEYAHLLEDSSL